MIDNQKPGEPGVPGGEAQTGATQQVPPPVAPPVPPPWIATPPPWWGQPPKRRSILRRFFRGAFVLIFIFSIVLNLYLLMFIGLQLQSDFQLVTLQEGKSDQVIAVYSLRGIIDDNMADHFARFVREVRSDDNIRGIVLRVDSPGGRISPSDRIAHQLRGLKELGKKVVVSMGGLGTSGGYYISAPAHEIIAEPATITGSIGVIGCWPVVKGTLEKLGVEMIVKKSTHARGWKDEGTFLRKPDAREHAHLQHILDSFQDRFEQVVREGRGKRLKLRTVSYRMSVEEEGTEKQIQIQETEPFNGKIYLGNEALELGLVDAIGYQPKAIQRAKELTGVTKPKVVGFRLRRKFFQELMQLKGSGALKLDIRTLDELRRPRIEMIWRGD